MPASSFLEALVGGRLNLSVTVGKGQHKAGHLGMVCFSHSGRGGFVRLCGPFRSGKGRKKTCLDRGY